MSGAPAAAAAAAAAPVTSTKKRRHEPTPVDATAAGKVPKVSDTRIAAIAARLNAAMGDASPLPPPPPPPSRRAGIDRLSAIAARLEDATKVIEELKSYISAFSCVDHRSHEKVAYELRVAGFCSACSRSTDACECTGDARTWRKCMARIASLISKRLGTALTEFTKPAQDAVMAVLMMASPSRQMLTDVSGTSTNEELAVLIFEVCLISPLNPTTVDAAVMTTLGLLIRLGLTPNTRTLSGLTALSLACLTQQHAVATTLLLLSAGDADRGGVEQKGTTGVIVYAHTRRLLHRSRALSIAIRYECDAALIRTIILRSSDETLAHSTETLEPPLFLAIERFVCAHDAAADDEENDPVLEKKCDASVAVMKLVLFLCTPDGGCRIDIIGTRWLGGCVMWFINYMCAKLHVSKDDVFMQRLLRDVNATIQTVVQYRFMSRYVISGEVTPRLRGYQKPIELVAAYASYWPIDDDDDDGAVSTASQESRRPATAAATAAAASADADSDAS